MRPIAGNHAGRMQSGRNAERRREVTDSDVDLSFDEIVWAGNEMIITTAEQQGAKPVYGISLKQPNTASRAQCVGYSMNLSISADGTTLALNNSRLTHPEVFVAKIGDSILKTKVPGMNVSHANDELLKTLLLPEPSSVTVTGADGDPMQMWILTPPGFDKTKKWPLAFLVHGGPQGAWADNWSFRWNPQIWAAQATSSPRRIHEAARASARNTPIRSAVTGAADVMSI